MLFFCCTNKLHLPQSQEMILGACACFGANSIVGRSHLLVSTVSLARVTSEQNGND